MVMLWLTYYIIYVGVILVASTNGLPSTVRAQNTLVTDVPCVKTTDSFIVIWGSCSGWLPLNWVLVPAVVLIPSNVRPCSVMVSFTCIVCVLFTDVRVGFVLSLACGVLVLMTLCVFCLGKGSFTVNQHYAKQIKTVFQILSLLPFCKKCTRIVWIFLAKLLHVYDINTQHTHLE